MRSWSVVEKFSLICLLISISGNGTWIKLEGGQWDGKKIEGFIFLSSLLNARLHFHVIHPHLIIQHKVSFSSRFISFFLFQKIKKIKNYAILCNLTCYLLLCLWISDLKCRQVCGKNMTKNSQANGSMRENVSVFWIAPSCFNKQNKCRYERTFKERNHLA